MVGQGQKSIVDVMRPLTLETCGKKLDRPGRYHPVNELVRGYLLARGGRCATLIDKIVLNIL